jgi:hypothetical protein
MLNQTLAKSNEFTSGVPGSKGGCLNQLAKCSELSSVPGGTIDIFGNNIYIPITYGRVMFIELSK